MDKKILQKIREALDGTLEVCSKPCDQCLFSKNKIVDDKRVNEILSDCEKNQTHFICHKGTIAGKNVVCNGFYRNRSTPYLDLMKASGKIVLVNPVTLKHDNDSEKIVAKVNSKKARKGKKL